MNESLNSPFRRPEEDLKIRNSKQFESHEIDAIINNQIDFMTENYLQNKEASLDLEVELGEDIKEKMAFVIEEALSYFHNLGFDSVRFNEVFYMHGNMDKTTGESNRNEGTIIHFAEIEDIQLRQLRFLKLLGHELYHSTAMASLTVTDTLNESGDEIHRYIHKDEGASYSPKSGPHDPLALEEGLASKFEAKLFAKTRELFSDDTLTAYDAFIELAYLEVNQNESDRDDIAIRNVSTNEGGYSTPGYAPARRLVNFLEKHIPDFNTLVEDARLNRRPLALARAVGNSFGKDAYRLITTAGVWNSDELIQKLTDMIAEKN